MFISDCPTATCVSRSPQLDISIRVGSHYQWHDGYWTRPSYAGAYWVAPYHNNGQYFAGHWEGRHGNVAHDHRWDQQSAG
jgi:hypothetical protein